MSEQGYDEDEFSEDGEDPMVNMFHDTALPSSFYQAHHLIQKWVHIFWRLHMSPERRARYGYEDPDDDGVSEYRPGHDEYSWCGPPDLYLGGLRVLDSSNRFSNSSFDEFWKLQLGPYSVCFWRPLVGYEGGYFGVMSASDLSEHLIDRDLPVFDRSYQRALFNLQELSLFLRAQQTRLIREAFQRLNLLGWIARRAARGTPSEPEPVESRSSTPPLPVPCGRSSPICWESTPSLPRVAPQLALGLRGESDQETDYEEGSTEDESERETDFESDNIIFSFLFASLFTLAILFVVQEVCNDLFGHYGSAA